ncbi:hypothetical protein L7F22_009271 [Adiantum nelumboides]|nr:hypothetical protein [Adiantum nelumboides]
MAFRAQNMLRRVILSQYSQQSTLYSAPCQRLLRPHYSPSNLASSSQNALCFQPCNTIPSPSSIRSLSSSTAEYGEEYDDGPNQRAKRPPRWYQRPAVWLLGAMPIVTLYLGIWQVKRLKWKLDLIDEMESKLKREPLSLPKNIDLDMLLEHYTNRLFTIAGSFPPPTPQNTIFLGPRVRDGQMGYHVLQPLQRDVGGGDIIVDRGFVPKDKIINFRSDPSTWRLMDTAFNNSTATHLLLLPRKKERNSFTPVNDPARHVWYFADVEEMVQYFSGEEEDQDTYTPSHGVAESVKSMLGLESSGGTKNVLPVYMEQIFEGNLGDASRYLQNGLPIGRAATVELRNQHAVYAATWFSLSAATSVMLAILIRKGPKA